MSFNDFSAKTVIFDLFLNSASSCALRYKQCYFHLELRPVTTILILLDVVTESEDDEGIPSFIFPVIDYLVSF